MLLGVLDDLGPADQLHAAQLLVVVAVLDHAGDPGVRAAGSDRLLRLGLGLDGDAPVEEAVPHGHGVDGTVVVERAHGHRPALVEEGVDLLGRHLDQVALLDPVPHRLRPPPPGSSPAAAPPAALRRSWSSFMALPRRVVYSGPAPAELTNSVHNVHMARPEELDRAPGEWGVSARGRKTWSPVRPDAPGPVAFVCTGNICRSPMAEVVLAMAAEPGARRRFGPRRPPGRLQRRHQRMARRRADGSPRHAPCSRTGLCRPRSLARPFETAWLESTDLVVCMDRDHRQTLAGLARASGDDRYEDRLVLLRAFDRRAGGSVDVPDPYYGDEGDFETCLDLVEAGCRGLSRAPCEVVRRNRLSKSCRSLLSVVGATRRLPMCAAPSRRTSPDVARSVPPCASSSTA